MTDPLIQQALAGQPLSCFVVDSHAHIGECFFPVIDPTADALVRAMDRCGVDVAVANSTPGCLAARIPEGNDEIIDAVRRFPTRILGMAAINPHRHDQSLDELKRCRDAGLIGIKTHDYIGVAYDDPRYDFAWQFAHDHRWPILLHTWGQTHLHALRPRFAEYQAVRWILGHAGAADRQAYLEAARDFPNVYLEIAASACPRGLIQYFVESGAEDRVLYGSDAVFMDMAPQLGRVVFAQIPLQAKLKILSQNAQTLFPLNPPD